MEALPIITVPVPVSAAAPAPSVLNPLVRPSQTIPTGRGPAIGMLAPPVLAPCRIEDRPPWLNGATEHAADALADADARASKRSPWTDVEDALLKQALLENARGDREFHWSAVSHRVPGRSGKQCRERWYNHLCPSVKKGTWSSEEDALIEQSVQEMGTKWCEIAKQMPGRTDNDIKNVPHRRDRTRALEPLLQARLALLVDHARSHQSAFRALAMGSDGMPTGVHVRGPKPRPAPSRPIAVLRHPRWTRTRRR